MGSWRAKGSSDRSQSSRLLQRRPRYRAEGEAAFEPRSRRPKSSPRATSAATVDLVVGIRKRLVEPGWTPARTRSAGTLEHHQAVTVSRATISRIRTAQGLVTPEPKKRPRS